jgi:hypothetical protein
MGMRTVIATIQPFGRPAERGLQRKAAAQHGVEQLQSRPARCYTWRTGVAQPRRPKGSSALPRRRAVGTDTA